ncbi:MAG: hypothetical protein AAB250_05775, partial [Bdellovibrionota bacterium]
SATFEAYRRYGVDEAFLTETQRALFVNPVAAIDKFPVDQNFLDFVRKENVAVLAYDSESTSPETVDSLYNSILRSNEPPSTESALTSMKSFDTRSKIMRANISELSSEYDCKNSVVVVGYAHLFRTDYVMSAIGNVERLSPIQESLAIEGFSSQVLIARQSEDTGDPAITFGPDPMNRFEGYVGQLRSSPRK